MTHNLFLSSRRFLISSFTRRPSCLAVMCLGLLLFQGCALLQGPSNTVVPSDSSAPTAAPKTSESVQPTPTQPTAKATPAAPVKLPQTGQASWYGADHQGKQTASGTSFDQARLTAAHPTLPFGSKIKVTNLGNGKSVEVEITDRGPFGGNRIIDLSQAAAKALDMIDSGTATVRLDLSSNP